MIRPDDRAWEMPTSPPTLGCRYEIEDSAGARFTGTIIGWSAIPHADGGLALRIEFADRPPFETDVPIRWRKVGDDARFAGAVIL